MAKRPQRAVLTTLRAAAIVIIATGVNEVIVAAVPRYEPLYVFLGAAALVVLLDGIVLGLLAAIAVTALYALLYMPRAAAMSLAVLEPFGWAITAVALATLVRGVIRTRARRSEPMPELFPRTPPPMLDAPPSRPEVGGPADLEVGAPSVFLAIEELRAELRERETMLERSYVARLQAADEERARLSQLLEAERAQRDRLDVAAREFEADARRRAEAAAEENDELRAAIETARVDMAELRKTVEIERAQARELEAEMRRSAATAAKENEELRAALETARADMAALRAGADELRKTLDIERARSDGERSLRTTAVERVAELERALGSERTGRESDASRHGEQVAALERSAAEERALRERLELDAQTSDAAGATLRARIAALELSLDSTRIGAEEELSRRERIEREVQTHVDESATLRARIAELEGELTEIAGGHEQEELVLRARIAELEAEVHRASEEFDQKLNTIVGHLATDHETDLGKALEEREEARAEARSLTLRLKKVDDERQTLLAKFREVEERYRQSIEDSTSLLEQTRTAAQGEIDRLHGRVAELENGFAVTTPPVLPAPRTRVLIAHPDPELRMSARTSLERAGYEVVIAADGLEALRTAIAERPDVVIADVVMPKMDGRELCQLLKSQEKTAHIRVVLLLRVTDEAPKGELCPDEVLRKPVPLEILKSTLAGLVARA